MNHLTHHKPVIAMAVLLIILLACLLADVIAPDPSHWMNADQISQAPSLQHPFGTDSLGRDLLSMILYGGRVSLVIGCLAAFLSFLVAVLYGCASGLGPQWLDTGMMRFVEILISIPSVLLMIFLQAVIGKATIWSIAAIIGLTSWMNMAKIVRTEVRQSKMMDYVTSARMMGAGFFYLLFRHLLPGFFSSVMFMMVMNISTAIAAEATLSFLGLGLPLKVVSWGSLLSQSQDALLSGNWWMILLPGSVLVVTLMCITDLGEFMRKKEQRLYSNL